MRYAPIALVSVLVTGCVSAAKHDALRERNDALEKRLAADDTALAGCEETRRVVEGELAALRDERDTLRGERDALEEDLAEAEKKAAASESARAGALAQSDARERRIEDLEALLRAHARVFRLGMPALRNGRLFGLQPGKAPRGPLASYLRPAPDDEAVIELRPDAVVQVAGRPARWMHFELDGDDLVTAVELSLAASGTDDVDAVKELLSDLCPKDRLRWEPGRPGPGTPKTDPVTGKKVPLVRIHRGVCLVEAGPWELAAHARHVEDGADLDKITLTLRFAP